MSTSNANPEKTTIGEPVVGTWCWSMLYSVMLPLGWFGGPSMESKLNECNET